MNPDIEPLIALIFMIALIF